MAKRKAKPRKVRYTIRKLDGVVHADEITGLLRQGFSAEANSPTAFIGVSFWGAFHPNGEMVGVAGALHSAIEEDTLYLNRSFVLPEHRGNGIQKALIKARVDRARELKLKFATSDTYDAPYSANNLIGCGFRAYEPKGRWRIEGAVYWRLPLASGKAGRST